MTYCLGIDLGTTYTSAAIVRDGRADTVSLGNRAPVIPSVVFLREDEQVLTGEAATRRGATEPGRVAREFKRRLGDPTPIIVGGSPYSADALMAKLLRWVVDFVTEQQGSAPSSIVVSHPANWGPYKTDLLQQAIARAGLDDVGTITEPEAAALHYASQARVEPGAVIAVFDLGGGTFDAAVLRKSVDGFETLGDPQGIERLGGVDFDEAVFQFVMASVGGSISELDPDDPTTLAAVSRLRQECVDAKEALSSDTDVSIPVMLPNLQTEVRLTRAEFEGLVRPTLGDAITALERALRSARVAPADVTTVLLVGGSSRIPLVAQMVGAALGRPVAVDAHPKHGVALGAALHAAHGAAPAKVPEAPTVAVVPPPPPAAVPAAPAAVPAAPAAVPAAPAAVPAPASPTPTPPPVAAAPVSSGPPPTVTSGAVPPPPQPAASAAAGSPSKRNRGLLIGLGVVAAIALVGGAVVVLGGDGDGSAKGIDTSIDDTVGATDAPSDESVAPETVAPDTTAAPTESTATTVAPETTPPSTTEPPPPGPFVRMIDVVVEDGLYVANYEVTGYVPQIDGGPDSLHVHLFLDDVEAINAGANGPAPGLWDITDEPSSFRTSVGPADAAARGAAQMCALVARVDHTHLDYTADTCVPLPA